MYRHTYYIQAMTNTYSCIIAIYGAMYSIFHNIEASMQVQSSVRYKSYGPRHCRTTPHSLIWALFIFLVFLSFPVFRLFINLRGPFTTLSNEKKKKMLSHKRFSFSFPFQCEMERLTLANENRKLNFKIIIVKGIFH